MRYIIGIDPGLTGALALFCDGKFLEVHDMPVMASGKGSAKVQNKVNGAALAEIIRGNFPVSDVLVYLENVSAFRDQGVSSIFSFGHSYGIVEGVITALGLPFTLVRPMVWKKSFNLLKCEKDVARTTAQQFYPTAPLTLKKHCGRADAILMARYGSQEQARLNGVLS